MIDSAKFVTFKALENVTVSFERLTLLVGPNGSGKSSVLDAIDLVAGLGSINKISLPARFGEGKLFDKVEHHHGHVTIEAAGTSYPFQFVQKAESQLEVYLGGASDLNAVFPSPRSGIRSAGVAHEYQRFQQHCGASKYLNLWPEILRQPQVSKKGPVELDYLGRGLPYVLIQIQNEEPERYQFLQDSMKRVVPGFRRFFQRQVEAIDWEDIKLQVEGAEQQEFVRKADRAGWDVVFEIWNEKLSARYISEGTLLCLGILSALLQPKRQRVFLIDDIDRGLHPTAQYELVTILRDLMKQIPELQIIATTHSPEMARCFTGEEIRLMNLDENGHATCKKLTDHPEYEKWKDSLDPGEFWASVGEDWILPRPATVNESK